MSSTESSCTNTPRFESRPNQQHSRKAGCAPEPNPCILKYMNNKTAPDSDHFIKRLQEESGALAQKYNFAADDLGRGFESWLAHLFVQESGFDEFLKETLPKISI